MVVLGIAPQVPITTGKAFLDKHGTDQPVQGVEESIL
jgi:hypothetical protein